MRKRQWSVLVNCLMPFQHNFSEWSAGVEDMRIPQFQSICTAVNGGAFTAHGFHAFPEELPVSKMEDSRRKKPFLVYPSPFQQREEFMPMSVNVQVGNC